MILTAVPEVMKKPEYFEFGMAINMLFHNLGGFAGPVLYGTLLDLTGWQIAGYSMVPICLIGAVAGRFVRVS